MSDRYPPGFFGEPDPQPPTPPPTTTSAPRRECRYNRFAVVVTLLALAFVLANHFVFEPLLDTPDTPCHITDNR